MRCTTSVVARPLAECWRAITDASLLPAWLPGVRRVRVVSARDTGLPLEVQFELAESLTYSLVYSYDLANYEVRWEPRIGKRDGVRGFARLSAQGDATELTYGHEAGEGRRASEDPDAIVSAFREWIEKRRRA